MRLRKPLDDRHDLFRRWHQGELTDEVLRVGVALADGRKATIFDGRHWVPGTEPPVPQAVLSPGSGSSGGRVSEFRFWSWPLPPEGPFAFVVEWPAEGIPLTRAEIDSAPIREAAGRAEVLWPDDPPAGPRTRIR